MPKFSNSNLIKISQRAYLPMSRHSPKNSPDPVGLHYPTVRRSTEPETPSIGFAVEVNFDERASFILED